MSNDRRYLVYWIAVLILSIFMAVACTKEPCDCGVLISNTTDSVTWTIRVDYCGEIETTVYHFPMSWAVGDTVCHLKELNMNDYNCKP